MNKQIATYAVLLLAAFIAAYSILSWQKRTVVETGGGAMEEMMQNMNGHGEMMNGSTSGAMRDKNAPTRTPADRKPLTYTVKDGVKEFLLTADVVNWEYAKGKTIAA